MDVQYRKSTQKTKATYLCQPIIWSMAEMLSDSTAAVAVVRTRPREIPLAMITMRKSTHGFPFVSHMSMGLRYNNSNDNDNDNDNNNNMNQLL